VQLHLVVGVRKPELRNVHSEQFGEIDRTTVDAEQQPSRGQTRRPRRERGELAGHEPMVSVEAERFARLAMGSPRRDGVP
jgi:hypothetical protein